MKDWGLVLTQTGKLVHAIFGFCDIRNFTDCTEVLRPDIVKLVNGVARHVHMCTKHSQGSPNKNIGNAFLLVWKRMGETSISDVADASLQSYVRAIVQMQMCDNVCVYNLRRLETLRKVTFLLLPARPRGRAWSSALRGASLGLARPARR
jgi:class 3 adenylate cyclase